MPLTKKQVKNNIQIKSVRQMNSSYWLLNSESTEIKCNVKSEAAILKND